MTGGALHVHESYLFAGGNICYSSWLNTSLYTSVDVHVRWSTVSETSSAYTFTLSRLEEKVSRVWNCLSMSLFSFFTQCFWLFFCTQNNFQERLSHFEHTSISSTSFSTLSNRQLQWRLSRAFKLFQDSLNVAKWTKWILVVLNSWRLKRLCSMSYKKLLNDDDKHSPAHFPTYCSPHSLLLHN